MNMALPLRHGSGNTQAENCQSPKEMPMFLAVRIIW